VNLDMKRPCANCPFRREGAIELRPGRLEDIIAGLADDDGSNFYCHKTVHGPHGGTFVDTDDEDGERYQASGGESACMGAVAYMLRAGLPSAAIRIALALKLLDVAQVAELYPEILEPGPDGMPI
jgi:hypothetical protein